MFQFFGADSRYPLEENTPEFDAFYATVEERMAEVMPNFDMARMRVNRQSSSCTYSLTDPNYTR